MVSISESTRVKVLPVSLSQLCLGCLIPGSLGWPPGQHLNEELCKQRERAGHSLLPLKINTVKLRILAGGIFSVYQIKVWQLDEILVLWMELI